MSTRKRRFYHHLLDVKNCALPCLHVIVQKRSPVCTTNMSSPTFVNFPQPGPALPSYNVSHAPTTLQVFNFGGGAVGIEATSVAVPLVGTIVGADACLTTIAVRYSNASAVPYYDGQSLGISAVVSIMQWTCIEASTNDHVQQSTITQGPYQYRDISIEDQDGFAGVDNVTRSCLLSGTTAASCQIEGYPTPTDGGAGAFPLSATSTVYSGSNIAYTQIPIVEGASLLSGLNSATCTPPPPPAPLTTSSVSTALCFCHVDTDNNTCSPLAMAPPLPAVLSELLLHCYQLWLCLLPELCDFREDEFEKAFVHSANTTQMAVYRLSSMLNRASTLHTLH